MEVHDIKVGDRVKTRKGDRYHKREARARVMTVVEVGKRWRSYEAAVCRYRTRAGNVRKGLFLVKNLMKVEE